VKWNTAILSVYKEKRERKRKRKDRLENTIYQTSKSIYLEGMQCYCLRAVRYHCILNILPEIQLLN